VLLTYTPPYLAEKILTSRTALEGERKQVTVLFADLKGSMELLAERDPEEAHALAERALALARAHQERGNQAYALRLLGDIAAHREPPEPTTDRPSPWPTSSACARSRPTATGASARCTPRPTSGNRPAAR
jgi:class 3 adenylate cyclase